MSIYSHSLQGFVCHRVLRLIFSYRFIGSMTVMCSFELCLINAMWYVSFLIFFQKFQFFFQNLFQHCRHAESLRWTLSAVRLLFRFMR